MNKTYSILAMLIFASSLLFAQEVEKLTQIVRKDRNVDDIDLLNSKYDLEKVEMDEVYMINNGKTEKVATSEAKIEFQAEVSLQIPKAPVSTTAANTEIDSQTKEDVVLSRNITQSSTQAGKSASSEKNSTQARASASSSNSATVKKKAKSKMKFKRIKLNKKRRPAFKRSKKGNCYRF